jgi:hypothetical protein
MRLPYVLTLAQLDDQHSIAACRSGIVHLIWGRITVRFSQDEFNRLAGLLAEATDESAAVSVSDGGLRITARPGDECECQFGPLVLLFAPTEFLQFARTVQEAARSLHGFLASGVWERETQEDAPQGALQQLQRIPFSLN